MSDSLPIVFDPAGKGSLQVKTLSDVREFCKLMLSAGMVPRGLEKPETYIMAVLSGLELGLSPMQSASGMCVVGNRPSVFGDTMLALCQRTGEMDDFNEYLEGEGENLRAVCLVKRKRFASTYKSEYSIKMAKHAGLLGKPGAWQTNPAYMLGRRARSKALRSTFADVLCGIPTPEDMDDEPILATTAPVAADGQEVVEEPYAMPDVDLSGFDPALAEALVASARAERWDRERLEAAVEARRSAKPRRRRAEAATAQEPAQETVVEATVIDVQAEPANDTLDSLL